MSNDFFAEHSAEKFSLVRNIQKDIEYEVKEDEYRKCLENGEERTEAFEYRETRSLDSHRNAQSFLETLAVGKGQSVSLEDIPGKPEIGEIRNQTQRELSQVIQENRDQNNNQLLQNQQSFFCLQNQHSKRVESVQKSSGNNGISKDFFNHRQNVCTRGQRVAKKFDGIATEIQNIKKFFT